MRGGMGLKMKMGTRMDMKMGTVLELGTKMGRGGDEEWG